MYVCAARGYYETEDWGSIRQEPVLVERPVTSQDPDKLRYGILHIICLSMT